jgi:DNA invertase Pin-like site-specific DNA recombinase
LIRSRPPVGSKIFSEKKSGKSTNGRPELDRAIKTLRPGDTLVTVKLDRLASSIRDLLHLLDEVKAANDVNDPNRT